ncbi:hypothetical protein C7S14_8500 [Burkholderia cepacia]|nr:hypothetical protein C7S14_8500 [Burkholderia cepacia]
MAQWRATIPCTRITKAEIGFSRTPGASLYFAVPYVRRFADVAIAPRSGMPELLVQGTAE